MGMIPLLFGAVSLSMCEETSSTDGEAAKAVVVQRLAFSPGVCVIPHPEKADKGGEDAYFISDDKKVLGVADGVGGWSRHGVDPALYSRALVAGSKKACLNDKINKDPVKIMQEGYQAALEIKGSATFCVVLMDGGLLKTGNLGDSGFMVIRGAEIVYRSKEQQHSFNFPFQLGGLTSKSKDRPTDADTETIPVMNNDIVVLGTDGLWDNLYDEQILQVVKRSEKNNPTTLATQIGKLASECANKRTGRSPFSDAAARSGRVRRYEGGKLDDITVVVGRVRVDGEGGEEDVKPVTFLQKLVAKL